ncbi:MAG: NAD(P)-dependent oxidoreductase [Rhizobiales bacterium]|nr:NAD(P)-dependent oxidoreductase [Hyphomicrobiales bacterium]
MSDIAIVGLGAMGAALARTLIKAGRDVTVWNRSLEKMQPLVAMGAHAASNFIEALKASSRIIVCLPDYDSTAELFEQPDVLPLLAGRTIIQLSTATPKEAVISEKWFNDQGASYLDGAILCWPGNIGTPSGQIAVAGPDTVFADCQTDLEHLAGDLRNLGANIRAPATIDLAFLSRTVGIIFGSIHGALICEAEGVPVSEFTAILPAGDRAVPLTQAINDGSFDTITAAGASVDIAGSAVTRMQQQALDAGINSELPDLLCDWVKRAQAAGYGSQETAAVIKVIRRSD